MSITIEPLGGLGNQLFTYATGRALAVRRGTDLVADLRNFEGYDWHSFELDSFASNLTVVEADGRYRSLEGKAQRIARRLGFRQRALVEETSTIFNRGVLDAPDGSRLRGYFQSWRYFADVGHIIREEVREVSNPSSWFERTRRELATAPPWLAIHVRRGNYVDIPNMGLVRASYYEQATELVTRLVGELPIVVFTDEPAHLSAALGSNLLERCRVIDSPPDSRPIETLVLMSDAQHIVTANSTFSWWAAWLGERESRFVICPRPWLDDPFYNDRDLIPPPWISLVRHAG